MLREIFVCLEESTKLTALRRCDFHCHSSHSDGLQSPTAVAVAMKSCGVSIFALTDHDTISGVHEAQAAARQQGLCCLGGIELTISWSSGVFHLLGLGLQDLPALKLALDKIQHRRQERNDAIMKKLRQHGVAIDLAKLQKYCGKNELEIINRSHMAAYLFAHGYSKSYNEAFRHYLADGASAYVAIDSISPEEGIKLIHSAGGYAFIAHPYSLRLDWQNFKYHVKIWHEAGLDGLEVFHPRTSSAHSRRLLQLAKSHDMQYCGGSDYHRGETMGVLGKGTARRPISLPVTMPYIAENL